MQATLTNKQLNALQAQETLYHVVDSILDISIETQADANTIIANVATVNDNILAVGANVTSFADIATQNNEDIITAIDTATSTIDTYTNTTGNQVVTLISDYIDASALSVDSGISREEGIWMVNNFTNTTGEQVVSDLTEVYAGVTESVVEAIDIARGLINDFTNETAETLSARMVVKVDALDGVVDAGIITVTDAITVT